MFHFVGFARRYNVPPSWRACPAGRSRAVDLMLQIPTDDSDSEVRVLEAAPARPRDARAVRVPGASTCSRTSRRRGSRTTTSASRSTRWTGRDREGDDRRRREQQARRSARCSEHPDRFFGSFQVNPNAGMDGVRDLVRAYETLGIKAATAFPAGLLPAGADQRQEVLSALRQVRGARHPDLHLRRRARAARADGGAGRRAARRGVLVLPGAASVVTRHGCEPWTDLAVKLMLKWPNLYYSTSAFAPAPLPQGHHRLREHARRRQGHVRRLLPDGADARADLQGAPGRSAPRRSVAEVPARQRDRVFKL